MYMNLLTGILSLGSLAILFVEIVLYRCTLWLLSFHIIHITKWDPFHTSYSFGQDAIFLLGGKTKAMPPSAMYLRSGDICVMGGESRMAYHAVPRILAASNPTYMDWNSQGEVTPSPADTQDPNRGSSSDMDACIKQEMNRMHWKPLNVFLKTSRINVNIRQVLKPGQTFPEEHGKVDNVPLSDGTVQEMPVTKRFKLSDSWQRLLIYHCTYFTIFKSLLIQLLVTSGC